MKRQQAVEDAIALRLVSNETGKRIDTLPPGKIFGMSITGPCTAPSTDTSGRNSLAIVQQTKNCRFIVFLWFNTIQYMNCYLFI